MILYSIVVLFCALALLAIRRSSPAHTTTPQMSRHTRMTPLSLILPLCAIVAPSHAVAPVSPVFNLAFSTVAVSNALTDVPDRTGQAGAVSRAETARRQAESAFRGNTSFRRWAHRFWKPRNIARDASRRNPDLTSDQILDAYQDWVSAGSPGAP